MGNFMMLSAFGMVELLLRLMTYISIIFVCYKGIKALNIYIQKNSN